MKKITIFAIAAAVAFAGSAYAKGKGNSAEAGAMAEALAGGPNNESGLGLLGGALNPEKGNNGKGTASDVSGGGNGGWGNVGSTLTGEPGESVSGR